MKKIQALQKAFKKVYGNGDMLFILSCYIKRPDTFPEEVKKDLEEIKDKIFETVYQNYLDKNTPKVYAWDKTYKDQDGATHFKYS